MNNNEEVTDVDVIDNNEVTRPQDRIDTELVLHNIDAQSEIFDKLQSYVKKHLKKGSDYGTIPGCNKPSLWKPGAEKICFIFNLVPKYEILKEVEKNEYTYKIRCDLINKNNQKFMGSGLGYASSKEPKFGKAPANTILKMSKKRAYIDATLTSTMASFIFTQDVVEEDDSDKDIADKQKQFTNTETRQINSSDLDPDTYVVNFGKFKGKKMIDVDSNYLEWLINQSKNSKYPTTKEGIPMNDWINFLEVCLRVHKEIKNSDDESLSPEDEKQLQEKLDASI